MEPLKGLPVLLLFVAATCSSAFTQAQDDDQLTSADLANVHVRSARVAPRGHRNGQADARFGVQGIDSLVNFNKHFQAPGVDQNGNPQLIWYYTTVGNPPEMGGTTTINVPIIPVSLDLRNFDGSPRFVNGHRLFYDATPSVDPLLGSPLFQNANYTSSDLPTQYTDAIQRAEFFNSMKPDWQTLLNPSVKIPRAITLIRGTYKFGVNPDGSCCSIVLVDFNTWFDKLAPTTIPPDNTTPIGAAEIAGEMTTEDITIILSPPNTFQFSGSFCCVGGFHTYDFEPGDDSNDNKERRYVLTFSSLFNFASIDVYGFSHELAEILNDPFVQTPPTGVTPWWLAPNGNCQDFLEVADVLENLPNSAFPITMPNGVTYHPQNVALRQWFEFRSPSNALHGAYSYPDESLLTTLSPPQKLNCN